MLLRYRARGEIKLREYKSPFLFRETRETSVYLIFLNPFVKSQTSNSMSEIEEASVPLPTAQVESVGAGISLLRPLSRRGYGPGLLLILPDAHSSVPLQELQEKGTPPPLYKWAEEGYTVAEALTSALKDASTPSEILKLAFASLQSQETCNPEGVIGLICESKIYPRS